MDGKRRFRPVPGVAHREVEGQTILLLPDDYALYTLNATGQSVWRAIVAGKTFAAMVKELTRRFAIDADAAASDVASLLDELKRRGIVEAQE